MKFGAKNTREWKPWFAWRPVRLDQEPGGEHFYRYVWLERIKRRRNFACGIWEYSL